MWKQEERKRNQVLMFYPSIKITKKCKALPLNVKPFLGDAKCSIKVCQVLVDEYGEAAIYTKNQLTNSIKQPWLHRT
jgi:hypothetical protein